MKSCTNWARSPNSPYDEDAASKECMAADNFSITKTTKGKLPRLPFAAIKDAVIGKSYNVSLVFIGDKRAQFLNRAYRRTSYIPNVLSFLLSKKDASVQGVANFKNAVVEEFHGLPESVSAD